MSSLKGDGAFTCAYWDPGRGGTSLLVVFTHEGALTNIVPLVVQISQVHLQTGAEGCHHRQVSSIIVPHARSFLRICDCQA